MCRYGGPSSAGLNVGLNVLPGLFQSKQFCDSLLISTYRRYWHCHQQGGFGMPRHVLFIHSLQNPKSMAVGLHVCKVPRWNGTDKLKKSWRSPSWCLSTVCPHTGKSWWWGWFLFLKKGRESCKVLYDSSIKPQDKTHRRIWCKKVGVLVESLEERCLNTLLVPGLDFKSFKEQMGMCVLTNEPSLWQFSWPPGQHLHLSTPPLLLPYS